MDHLREIRKHPGRIILFKPALAADGSYREGLGLAHENHAQSHRPLLEINVLRPIKSSLA